MSSAFEINIRKTPRHARLQSLPPLYFDEEKMQQKEAVEHKQSDIPCRSEGPIILSDETFKEE